MSDVRDPDRDQALPGAGHQPVQNILIQALIDRRQHGIRKYGRPLETGNGRDALTDLWEELVDAVSYLTQLRLERGDHIATLSPQQARRTAVTEALYLVQSGPGAVPCEQCDATVGLTCRGTQVPHRCRVVAHREVLVRALRAAVAAESTPPGAGTGGRAPGAGADAHAGAGPVVDGGPGVPAGGVAGVQRQEARA